MEYEKLQSRLKSFVFVENCLKRKFKEKLDKVNIKEYTMRMETASALWRDDSEVDVLIEQLKKIAEFINLNFTEYKLIDILLHHYAFLGFHEELMYEKFEDHILTDLIEKQHGGYCYSNVSSYVINRFSEYLNEEQIRENNMRGEMAIFYLGLFTSRILFSPHNKYSFEFAANILNKPIKNLIYTNISLPESSLVRTKLLEFIRENKKDLLSNNLTREKYGYLVDLSIRNLLSMLSIVDFLKAEIYEADWQVLRPSFFQKSKTGWTWEVAMCRTYEGPEFLDTSFPYESNLPKRYLLYC